MTDKEINALGIYSQFVYDKYSNPHGFLLKEFAIKMLAKYLNFDKEGEWFDYTKQNINISSS